MGSFTPKPNIKQINIKFTSGSDRKKLEIEKNEEVPAIKNK